MKKVEENNTPMEEIIRRMYFAITPFIDLTDEELEQRLKDFYGEDAIELLDVKHFIVYLRSVLKAKKSIISQGNPSKKRETVNNKGSFDDFIDSLESIRNNKNRMRLQDKLTSFLGSKGIDSEIILDNYVCLVNLMGMVANWLERCKSLGIGPKREKKLGN